MKIYYIPLLGLAPISALCQILDIPASPTQMEAQGKSTVVCVSVQDQHFTTKPDHLWYITFPEIIDRFERLKGNVDGTIAVYDTDSSVTFNSMFIVDYSDGRFQSSPPHRSSLESVNWDLQIEITDGITRDHFSEPSNMTLPEFIQAMENLKNNGRGIMKIIVGMRNPSGKIDHRKVVEREFQAGGFDGYSETYFLDGKEKSIIEQTSFVDGFEDGQRRLYSTDGTLYITMDLKRGERHGYFHRFYSNGSIFQKYFHSGEDHDWERIYWPNGDVLAEGTFKGGKHFEGEFLIIRHFEDPPFYAQTILEGGSELLPEVTLDVFSHGEKTGERTVPLNK